ncbi:permease [Aliamphritea ceti]|uniref:permease n=1 Tax=Aliamphritea ceti TaxID=1524258 RepID=UPI0021C2EEE5|nr:permease [Aliamphritea ceti]
MSPEIVQMLEDALGMFAFLAVELTLLFLAISYLVGVLQEFITPEKIQSILSSRNGKGYVIAALLGAITPFCSCSTIPFLKGLLRARAGFGPMMVFLFSSPLLNPVIIGLFVITFGLQVAVMYFSVALVVSVTAGFVLEKLGFERYVREEAYQMPTASGCGASSAKATESACGASDTASACSSAPAATESRWVRIWKATWKDFKQVVPYLLLGICLGSFIYGFIPTDLIAKYAGEATWYAIPIAAVIGIPLYIRAEAVIPLSAALVKKGMALGSVMALIIGSAGASLTEVILLKAIFKNQMIAAFLVVILSMAIFAGMLFNLFI